MKRIGFFFAIMFVLSAAVYAQSLTIQLTGDETGWLYYDDGVSTQCWFQSTTPLKTRGTYTAEVSRMASGIPGIIIYGGPNNLSSGRGIFIHGGTSAANSKGCIVIPAYEMRTLYNKLESKYGLNGRFTISVQ